MPPSCGGSGSTLSSGCVLFDWSPSVSPVCGGSVCPPPFPGASFGYSVPVVPPSCGGWGSTLSSGCVLGCSPVVSPVCGCSVCPVPSPVVSLGYSVPVVPPSCGGWGSTLSSGCVLGCSPIVSPVCGSSVCPVPSPVASPGYSLPVESPVCDGSVWVLLSSCELGSSLDTFPEVSVVFSPSVDFPSCDVVSSCNVDSLSFISVFCVDCSTASLSVVYSVETGNWFSSMSDDDIGAVLILGTSEDPVLLLSGWAKAVPSLYGCELLSFIALSTWLLSLLFKVLVSDIACLSV